MEKFELVKEDSIEVDGHKLFRIRALKDFDNIKVGDLGGYVEHEYNLSQYGNCWVYGADCNVYENGSVIQNAKVFGSCDIYGYATIGGNANLIGGVIGTLDEYINQFKESRLRVFGEAKISGDAVITDVASIYGKVYINDKCSVYGDAEIYGTCELKGCIHVGYLAKIEKNSDYFSITNIGSRGDTTTFYKASNGRIWVNTGCCHCDIKIFKEKVKKTHAHNKLYKKQYLQAIKYAKKLIK